MNTNRTFKVMVGTVMVRQDVGRGSRRIIVHNKPAEDRELVERNKPGEQIKPAWP